VGGRNRITDFEEVVRLEQSYIRHWSIWKDVAILARTIPAVVRFDGAL
jgi:lipopolysaccharide/colanic/teichoic acid biosynthesis glycosyltransferase